MELRHTTQEQCIQLTALVKAYISLFVSSADVEHSFYKCAATFVTMLLREIH